jgi:hypothetical protein
MLKKSKRYVKQALLPLVGAKRPLFFDSLLKRALVSLKPSYLEAAG